jgi:hypothetical protein
MGAGLPGQCDRLRRAAAADNRSGPQGARRHLHREMPEAAPTARDIDRVTGLHSPVKTRKSGQEGHRKRRRVAEAQGWRLAGGEELACNGVAAFAASAPARCDPAAITVQIGHGGHRVADLNATHTMAHGDNHASEIKTENDGGVRPMKLRSASLYSNGLSDEAATRIRTWSAAGCGTRTRTASSGSPARSLV